MIAMLTFSAVAALLVYLAGRGDAARDPRLTLVALGLLAVFPVLWFFLPKVGVLPAGAGSATGGEGSGISWLWIAGAVWAAGFSYGAVRLVLAARGISGWRMRSVLSGSEDGVEIRRLDGLRGPVAAGVFRKVVFVPAAWETWPHETRRMVMEHELAHHRRRDPLWRWIAEIACVVNGCNPLVTWMARRLAEQCEYACDAEVLSRGGVTARDYARLLCDFAESGAPRVIPRCHPTTR
ncbi:MAG: M56 family metallopeptidase, partial [Verrucomicrobiaceae bacterium]